MIFYENVMLNLFLLICSDYIGRCFTERKYFYDPWDSQAFHIARLLLELILS